ncbi:glutaredoxin family protein [Catelliglobosispora koreensis]|uniref:glutaredoxin family protein n=1 Tax=Catelliglobosispora koreensis TaxID=129052 RepID=UPI00035C523C|nr:glutaredoxin family protein [Catelliglobosispora koreensis]
MSDLHRLTLYTRPGCHLCETAVQVLKDIGEPFTEVDISTDLDLEIEYGDRIPVLMLDGKEHGYWRVEKERLLRDLAR